MLARRQMGVVLYSGFQVGDGDAGVHELSWRVESNQNRCWQLCSSVGRILRPIIDTELHSSAEFDLHLVSWTSSPRHFSTTATDSNPKFIFNFLMIRLSVKKMLSFKHCSITNSINLDFESTKMHSVIACIFKYIQSRNAFVHFKRKSLIR